MNQNTGIRLLEVLVRDHQVRRAVMRQGARTASDFIAVLDSYADQWAYEIACHQFAKEQRIN